MLVKELIERLSKVDPNLDIMIQTEEELNGYATVTPVLKVAKVNATVGKQTFDIIVLEGDLDS